jgi:putative hydrolase of the HAD superfamily
MPPISAVLFDYGMVLSAPPLPSAWERMKSITGIDEDALHAGYWHYRHAYDRGTHTGEEFWRLATAYGGTVLDDSQVADLLVADIDLWGELNQPMIGWVWRLHRAGVRTGILSNMGDAMAAGLQAKYPWLQDFHHRTWSYTLKLAKPEPAIYRHAIAGLETAPAEILFIDDKQENISAGQEAGLQTLHYTTHTSFEAEMFARGLGDLLRLLA